MNQPVNPRHTPLPPKVSWLLLGLGLAVLAVFVTVSLVTERNRVWSLEKDRLMTQTKVVAENLNSQLEGVNLALEDLLKSLPPAWNPTDQAVFSSRFVNLADAMPGIRGMAVLDASGTVVVSSNKTSLGLGLKMTNRAYFQSPQRHPDAKTLFISPPFQGRNQLFTLSVTRMVPGVAGEFHGVIMALLDPEYFKTLLDSVRYATDMEIGLVHQDGQQFLSMPPSPPPPSPDTKVANPWGNLFTDHLEKGQPVSVLVGSASDGPQDRLVVLRTVRSPRLVSDKSLVVGASRDLRVVFTPWTNQVWTYGVLFLLLGVGSSLALRNYQGRVALLETAERESAERMKLATETAGVGVWELDPTDGRLVWDHTMYDLYGRPQEEDLSLPAIRKDWVVAEDREATEKTLADALAGESRFEVRFRIARGSGEVRTLHAAAKIFRNRRGKAVRVIGVTQDITAQVAAQLQLEVLNESLRERTAEAEQASLSKSQFLANMSHEIRTPMNAVLGLLSLLKKTELTRRQHDYVAKVETAAHSLLAILNDILDFSKVEAGKMELEQAPFSPSELLRNLAVILGAMVQDKDVEVLFQIAPDLPSTLVGDSLRLHQVLLNLAGNAVKFTNQGEVVISIEILSSGAQGVEVRFAVADTGIGIAADVVAGLFAGFVQAEASTARRFGGTGLGLAISQRLVGLMGSTLEVASESGRGSTFSFSVLFPLGPGSNDSQRPEASTLFGPPDATRALVVDDNAVAQEVLATMLTSLGWSVDTASGGQEALEKAKPEGESGFPYQVVFVDWKMPGMDGWETIERLRNTIPEKKKAPMIIMVTAHGRELLADRMQSEEAALDGFLVKPVTASMLYDAIADVASGRSSSELVPTDETHSPGLRGYHLLVVEDNKTNQMVIRELLKREGATVVVASGGRQALDILAEQRFDAVLMDVQMPDMDGYETTRQLRRRFGPGLPVFAVTANVLSGEKARCLEAGMNGHIGKPIEMDELMRLLKQEAPSHHSPGPQTPGVDTQQALARMGGDRDLYRNVVSAFLTNHADFLAELIRDRDTGNLDAGLRNLHTMKGLAATVGLFALAAESAAVEAQWAQAPDSPPLFHRLEKLWQEATEALGPFREKQRPSTDPQAEDSGGLDDLLKALRPLLAEGNLKATELVPADTPAWGPGFEELASAIRRLDFEDALKVLQRLQERK